MLMDQPWVSGDALINDIKLLSKVIRQSDIRYQKGIHKIHTTETDSV